MQFGLTSVQYSDMLEDPESVVLLSAVPVCHEQKKKKSFCFLFFFYPFFTAFSPLKPRRMTLMMQFATSLFPWELESPDGTAGSTKDQWTKAKGTKTELFEWHIIGSSFL